jgi:hypothetical protein
LGLGTWLTINLLMAMVLSRPLHTTEQSPAPEGKATQLRLFSQPAVWVILDGRCLGVEQKYKEVSQCYFDVLLRFQLFLLARVGRMRLGKSGKNALVYCTITPIFALMQPYYMTQKMSRTEHILCHSISPIGLVED